MFKVGDILLNKQDGEWENAPWKGSLWRIERVTQSHVHIVEDVGHWRRDVHFDDFDAQLALLNKDEERLYRILNET